MNTDQNSRDLISAIEKGLRNDEFKMYLQFIVDNKTKDIVSAEALSRWETENNVLIFPGKYIGIMCIIALIAITIIYVSEYRFNLLPSGAVVNVWA